MPPSADLPRVPLRTRMTPAASVLAASLLAALPVIATAAVLPPFGLLALLAWRLLRPELWPVWAALPFGLFDDLVSGQPLGSGMASWTCVFLAIDRLDRRFPQRGWRFDWWIAAAASIFVLVAGMLAAALPLTMVPTILPQIAITILAFPAVSRTVAALDRWRLKR
ncbi:rod shape-determining protein MreD [Sphingomonas jatrophae]|uniref:Rod shape-determining protein MreD n=1 Tax=Sphingomonas jatrophae TaxID=1166337 RepID=A0A1I6M113_9SPHN|nr:rod shape-determining protein MreD [Sphingomonas jatrophae]SFS09318.1 rod shape-determining protein MreD [Sphingomonas jatrophae]